MKTKKPAGRRSRRKQPTPGVAPAPPPAPPAAPAVRAYALHPEAYQEETARLLRGLYAAFLLVLIAGTLLALRHLDFNTSGTRMVWSIGFVTVSVVFSLSAGFYTIFRSIRLRREEWDSYQLLVGEDCLVRREADHPDLELRRADIVQVQETLGRGLTISTRRLGQFIFVPATLDGYEDLKGRLARWMPLAPPRTREALWRSPFFVGAVCLAGYAVLYVSDNKKLVVAAAFVLTSFLLTTFITVRRSPNVRHSLRRAAWIYLLVVPIVLMRVWQVFSPRY